MTAATNETTTISTGKAPVRGGDIISEQGSAIFSERGGGFVGIYNAAAMNLTSADAPPFFNEAHLAQLELGESDRVRPPRIVTAPAAFECRVLHFIETGAHQVAILAEVVFAHVRDEYVAAEQPIRIDVPAMNLIARLHGAGWYGRQTDTFELLRPKWRDVGPAADNK